jgi:hypothetical protein
MDTSIIKAVIVLCPICEKLNKPTDGFLSTLSAPARRVLENTNITTLLKLSKLTEAEVLKLHGMGPGSLPKLRSALESKGLAFRKK